MISDLYKQFDALGDSNRLKILDLFTNIPELTPTLVCEYLNISSALLTHHLRVLKGCGLINVQKSGRIKVLTLNKPELERLSKAISEFTKGN